jgi:hypothetical protein
LEEAPLAILRLYLGILVLAERELRQFRPCQELGRRRLDGDVSLLATFGETRVLRFNGGSENGAGVTRLDLRVAAGCVREREQLRVSR